MDKKILSFFIAGILTLGLVVLIVLFGGSNEPVKKQASTGTVKREDAYYKGKKDSGLEIVEFSDFQCPACGASSSEMKKVVENYGDKIVFYYRHFPLPQHKLAFSAAKAVEAAGKQDKFWEMHDLIFQNQSGLTNESFLTFANQLKLEMKQYEKDYNSLELSKIVEADKKDAEKNGVNSTPTFYLNGEKVQGGGLKFEDWKKLIDAKLTSINNKQ